jgi:hypothetical protein
MVLGWGAISAASLVAGLIGWRIAQRKESPPLAWNPGDGLRRVNSNGEPLPDSEPVVEPPATTPTREGFLKHMGTEFEIDVNGVRRDCKLVDVSPGRTLRGKGATFTAYAILFQGPSAFKFESGTYRVKHPEMGTMELFLTQVGRFDKISQIEAVFSERV